MKQWVGSLAGIIWHVLENCEEKRMELIQLESHVSEADPNMTNFEFHMALGWLMRENNIQIQSEDAVKIVQLSH